MAYIPPHKRHSYEAAGSSDRQNTPSPIPQSLVPQFRRNLNLRLPPKPFSQRSGKIVYKYAEQAISTWFPVGLDHNHQFPSSVHVDSVPLQLFERTTGTSPLVLFNNNNNHPVEQVRSPWVYIAENVVSDLLSSFENVKNEILDLEDVKPKLVARFGKILFHESPSISEETTRVGLAAETTLSQLRRSFYTNIPNSYMENIKGEVAQKIKVDFEEEKDLYRVQLSDATLPDSTISCKCSVIIEDKRLQLSKIELQTLRHMVVDISCLDKNLDLRLMLSTKRTLTALTEQEVEVSSLTEMLKDHLKLIWDHFLCCEHFLT
ncbi:uncharacterized protein LOC142614872 isoform X2 [Castanea sativa]|uniref:uncharacterized protein LOC142614872 isoform X2 n=1 Tax=Castanea sativa TaxID=21020 RepID=UPI003F651581